MTDIAASPKGSLLDADMMLSDILLEAYLLKAAAEGIEHEVYLVPARAIGGSAWFCHWISTGGVISGWVKTERPMPVEQLARYVNEHVPNLALANVTRWPHAGCGQNPFTDELGGTGYFLAGEGAH